MAEIPLSKPALVILLATGDPKLLLIYVMVAVAASEQRTSLDRGALEASLDCGRRELFTLLGRLVALQLIDLAPSPTDQSVQLTLVAADAPPPNLPYA
jgi:hypothetical protein